MLKYQCELCGNEINTLQDLQIFHTQDGEYRTCKPCKVLFINANIERSQDEIQAQLR